ncbi:hypothetical protein P153DRAFT_356146 [Dothidotthia symphoricarpi CBS 119687]|uniref:Uncharacterized protein n=1 Tax=Dothidotthia symphoricarpi CBS 119687 TaxID=1392245 RepID=A0A6A6AGY5_9PLEO|nr:uncharacterized protein P153DRAFT_356146 [Dothidotthia symphoricarpi CBS 119687]KAF2130365.1 hypothetical protein P153DRAFT_356146 [Dothidotthia symphoricarpi CBS 119687]
MAPFYTRGAHRNTGHRTAAGGATGARIQANTGAGIDAARRRDRDRDRARERVREVQRRRQRDGRRDRPPPPTPTRRLVDRMTGGEYGATQDNASRTRLTDSVAARDRQLHVDHGGTDPPRPQQVGSLQYRFTGAKPHGFTLEDGAHARKTVHAQHKDSNINIDITNNHINYTTSPSTPLFCSSQPTQLAISPQPPKIPSKVPSCPSFSLPLPSKPPAPIRLFNKPLTSLPTTTTKRPVNPYRGKDPVKRLVQNPKLRAIFAGKPLPRERKKAPLDRMELRMAMQRVSK